MESESNMIHVTDRKKRDKSVDNDAAMETRMARVEGVMDEHSGILEEVVEKIKVIEDTNEEFKNQVTGTLNEVNRNMQEEIRAMVWEEVGAALDGIMARLEAMEGRMALFERAMANGDREVRHPTGLISPNRRLSRVREILGRLTTSYGAWNDTSVPPI